MVVRVMMGFGSKGFMQAGFRRNVVGTNGDYQGYGPEWSSYVHSLDRIVARLAGVVIENRPALEIIEANDHRDCLLYLDPPFLGCGADVHRTPDERGRPCATAGQALGLALHDRSLRL